MSEGNGQKSKLDQDRLAFLEDADADFLVVPVHHPNGKTYYIKKMSAAEEGQMGVVSRKKDGEGADPVLSLAAIVQASLCNEEGELLFGPAHIGILIAKTATFLKPIARASMKLNKLGGAEVEEAEKNSEATPAASSSSASPVTST